MRKKQHQEILEMVATIQEAHEEIKKYLERNQVEIVKTLMTDCHESMITIGNAIENIEGEGHITVTYAEKYCETVYQIFEELSTQTHFNENRVFKELNKAIIKVENSIKNDINIRKVAVFLPYKVSMWDSLESVWMAADADPECDAYVMPIPYYDKNPDGSFKAMHYEGDQYPDYVTITDYKEFDFGKHHPDMIFIHNPYDSWNTVTSVHPFFFSDNLKKFTDCLVYIPYFATAGGMSEGQSLCPAYINADYIVIQSEKYRKYYDPRIPDKKFLPFGSPKFDSVIRKCQNPPEPPEEWKEMMTTPDGKRKKVYFYNTSIGGMLSNTEAFLKKMEYVFNTFSEHPEVCLLWRPHPLLESTFDSMRMQYKSEYEKLKQQYIDDKIGIFDTTSAIENTIALSDVYIGDAGTSVTSLFGVVGKPMFILNNEIHSLPTEDDYRGEYFQAYNQSVEGKSLNKCFVSQRNELYYSSNDDRNYKFFCNLSEYQGGRYYSMAVEHEEKIYVMPANAQDILVIDKDKKIKKIELNKEIEQGGAFSGVWIVKNYAFILPYNYPSMIRLNMDTEEVTYIGGIRDFNIGTINGEKIATARWISREKIYMLNPVGNQMLVIDIDTLDIRQQEVTLGRTYIGVSYRKIDDDEVWLLPYQGTIITRWNVSTDEQRDYDLSLPDMKSIHRTYQTITDTRYFGSTAFNNNTAIVAPMWGNKFVELDTNTGDKKEWIAPFDTSDKSSTDYIKNGGIGGFTRNLSEPDKYMFFYQPERKLYKIDIMTKIIEEIPYTFGKETIKIHKSGYGVNSQWLQYSCNESVTDTLEDLINDKENKLGYSKEKQLEEFAKINASKEGNCGETVYRYVVK